MSSTHGSPSSQVGLFLLITGCLGGASLALTLLLLPDGMLSGLWALSIWISAGLALGGWLGFFLMRITALNLIQQNQSRALAIQEQRYRSLIDQNTDAVFSLDMQGRYQEINPAYASILCQPEKNILCANFDESMSCGSVRPTDRERILQGYTRASQGHSQSSIAITVHRSGAELMHLEVALFPIVVDRQVASVFGIAKDVSERVRAEECQHIMERSLEASKNAAMNHILEKKEQDQKLAYHATHDPLTGLGNRSLFDERLHCDFELAKLHKRRLAVLFIDLDEFKPINDTLGHKVGDKLLLSVAKCLSAAIRSSDTLARFGGDEFVLLLPDLDSDEEAEEIAGRLMDVLARPHRVHTHELYISASIGIALISDDTEYPEKLVQRADMAMYKAKQLGRNAYEVFGGDLDKKLSRRVALRNDLQEAIEQNQLYLHYQPVINHSGTVEGIEALVRWTHPTKGNISPGDFIPIAEETGQIVPLSRWVLKRACQDTLELINMRLFKGVVAVNLSPLQFHRPNFLTTLRQVLEDTSLSPKHLELELTEGILMKDTEKAISILDTLSQMGVSTAIDDFGSGFSSFSYLRELPVDKIKIDQSFVKGVTINTKDAAVCTSVLTLARELDLKVVAEGVETEEQYHYLRQLGCESFQGYWFCFPMPLDELTLWLFDRASRALVPGYTDSPESQLTPPNQ